MPRSRPEWRGKTDDDPVPPRVRLRIFERMTAAAPAVIADRSRGSLPRSPCPS
jgi:hypothetical protein